MMRDEMTDSTNRNEINRRTALLFNKTTRERTEWDR